ncbi:MAG: nitronate monooxygenase [Actinomycetota bacterium]
MGVAVSSWRLARAVSQTGQLGVVSGTALDTVVARRLQDGDIGGHIRRALEQFPVLPMAQRVLRRYFRPAGRAQGQPYVLAPHLSLHPSTAALELSIVANFAEVWLAKEGHDGLVGINYLEKVQMATPSAAYGAMLADVDYVLMGAGIPAEIPQLLNQLADQKPCSLKIHVDGATTAYSIELDPQVLTGGVLPPLRRPMFLAIVSAHTLATFLAREEATCPDGFVIEGPRSGGHNAPPRGHLVLDEDGQPIFGPRDDPDFDKVVKIGLPFWLAGGYSTPKQLGQAQLSGAVGVQVGSLFALSAESGFSTAVRRKLLTELAAERLVVRTDPLASPTGFPFKVASLPDTFSEKEICAARPRLCDLGYLRVPYERAPGIVGYRCPGEPVRNYLRKGGVIEETVGRKCLCNGLMATVGIGQTRSNGYQEFPLVTLGADFGGITEMITIHPDGWSAAKVVSYLLS